jgi:hypothetical protein
VDHGRTASYDPSHCQRSFCQFIDHTPVYGDVTNTLARVNTPVYGDAMNGHLAKSDWIEHGLRALASDGANVLKIGPISVTRQFLLALPRAGRSAPQIGLFATSRRAKPNQTGSNSLHGEPLSPSAAWKEPSGPAPQKIRTLPRPLPPSMPAGSPT